MFANVGKATSQKKLPAFFKTDSGFVSKIKGCLRKLLKALMLGGGR